MTTAAQILCCLAAEALQKGSFAKSAAIKYPLGGGTVINTLLGLYE